MKSLFCTNAKNRQSLPPSHAPFIFAILPYFIVGKLEELDDSLPSELNGPLVGLRASKNLGSPYTFQRREGISVDDSLGFRFDSPQSYLLISLIYNL